MFLALGGSGEDVLDEVPRLWNSGAGEASWPVLPPSTVVRLGADRVEIEGDRSRELGEIRNLSDPRERIRGRLDDLRKRLGRKYVFFEGLAFGHE